MSNLCDFNVFCKYIELIKQSRRFISNMKRDFEQESEYHRCNSITRASEKPTNYESINTRNISLTKVTLVSPFLTTDMRLLQCQCC